MRWSRLCIAALVSSLLVLTACTWETRSGDGQGLGANRAGAELKTLHNKIVYVVRQPARTPESKKERFSLCWIDPQGTKPHVLFSTENPPTETLSTFYLPERQKMLVHMAVSRNTKTGNDYVADIDGRNPKVLVRGRVSDIFPDSKHLLVSSDLSEGDQSFFLYSVDLQGRALERLSFRPEGVVRKSGPDYVYEGDSDGRVSPDGKTIVYESSWHSQGSGNTDIVRMNSDGSAPTRLTNAQKTNASFSLGDFSHDGRTIAAMKRTPEGAFALVLMDAEGRLLHEFVVRDSDAFGGWSPRDDQVVLFGLQRISVLDVSNGTSTEVVSLDDLAGSTITSALWLD